MAGFDFERSLMIRGTLTLLNYVDVDDHATYGARRRPHFTRVPTANERAQYRSENASWTVDALYKTARKDDPEHFRLLDRFLNLALWEQLTFAIGVLGAYPFGCEFPEFRHIGHLVSDKHPPEVRDWAVDMCHKAAIYHYEALHPVRAEFVPPDSRSVRIDLSLIMRSLLGCSELAEALRPLCDPNSPLRGLLAPRVLEDTLLIYEAMRPAADMWRCLPDEAIAPFVQLGAAAELIANADKHRSFELERQISAVGFMLDDNEAHKQPQVAKWWRWTKSAMEYDVHRGIDLLTPQRFVRALRNHLQRACAAFDPGKPSNLQVLAKLDKGAEWLGHRGPIIRDISGAYRLLREQKMFFAEGASRVPQLGDQFGVHPHSAATVLTVPADAATAIAQREAAEAHTESGADGRHFL